MEKDVQNESTRKRRRNRRWYGIEYGMFAAALALVMLMSGTGIIGAASDAGGLERENVHYLTFVRGMLTERGDSATATTVQDTQSAQTQEKTLEEEKSTIEQYDGAAGDAGTIYEYYDDAPEYVTEILQNYDELPEELQSLAAKNIDALGYVAGYKTLKHAEQTINLSAEARSKTVPRLYQWDVRWGYQSYGSGMIGYTGCGPTALSMVLIYLTGNADYDPGTVASYADEAGYAVAGNGTAWSFMYEGCEHFGVSGKAVSISEGALKEALDEGMPVICAMKPGDFTAGGHFIVLTGYSGDYFQVNDPNSIIRSNQLWSYSRLAGQFNGAWGMYLSDSSEE